MACGTVPEATLIALPSQARPQTAVQTAADLPGAILVVRSVAVPEYMRSRRVRYWADPETIAQWPDAYWAERIEVGMTREFLAALRRRLPHWTICETGCGDSRPVIMLTVDLVRLDFVRREHEILATAQIGVSETQVAPPSAGVEPLLNLSLPVATDSPQGEAQAIADILDQLAERAATRVESRPLPPR